MEMLCRGGSGDFRSTELYHRTEKQVLWPKKAVATGSVLGPISGIVGVQAAWGILAVLSI